MYKEILAVILKTVTCSLVLLGKDYHKTSDVQKKEMEKIE